MLRGNGPLECTMQEVEKLFVLHKAAQRLRLYAELQRYNSALRTVVGQPFRQWIDGSFISAQPLPNDLDLVSFLPYEAVKGRLDQLVGFYQLNLAYAGLEAYLVLQHLASDSRYFLSRADEGYWNDLFRKTRPNRFGQAHTKAFMEILVEAP